MTSYVNQLLLNLRLADILDIVAVGILLYVALQWMRKRTSRAVSLVVVLVAVLYLCARALGMYLTLLFFQTGLSILILALVIVFQQDIRHTFEQFFTWRLMSRRRLAEDWSDMVDTLIEAVTLLSKQYTGALFVVKGHEPIEQLIRGGLELEANPSVPLLLSIFHPDSPGHDGAIVVQHNRVEKFAVHLPLTRHLAKIGQGATRHAAALGLAECCDAFIIVISEERGTVSIAHEGNLESIKSLAELKARLTSFYEEIYPVKPVRHWSGHLTRNLGLKLLSIGLASVLWLAIAYRPEIIQRTIETVPIEIRNLKEGLVIEEVKPPNVKVTLTGPEQSFRDFDEKKLKVSIDLGKAEHEGTVPIPLKEKQLDLPPRLSARLEPKTVKLTIYRRKVYNRPIALKWTQHPKSEFTISTKPALVRVEMRVVDANKIKEIPTARIPFTGRAGTFHPKLKLPPHVSFPGDQQPQVTVIVSPVQKKEKKENQVKAEL